MHSYTQHDYLHTAANPNSGLSKYVKLACMLAPILKHVSDWHCANFVIFNLHVECKNLKHKNLCKEAKSKAKLHSLFVCVF